MLSVPEAARELGVSPRTVYDLAAPGGPIPCHRVGRRILFSPEDLSEYLQSCRYTETKRAVASSLNSTVSLKGSGSALEKLFQSRGVKPKLTPTTVRSRPDSTRLQLVSSARSS